MQKYTYPKFSNIKFTFPIDNEKWEVSMVNGLLLLSSLGIDQLTISPFKWDRVNSQISKGLVEYPESNNAATIGEGRYRTLALMKIYGIAHMPCVVLKEYSERFRINEQKKGMLQ